MFRCCFYHYHPLHSPSASTKAALPSILPDLQVAPARQKEMKKQFSAIDPEPELNMLNPASAGHHSRSRSEERSLLHVTDIVCRVSLGGGSKGGHLSPLGSRVPPLNFDFICRTAWWLMPPLLNISNTLVCPPP